ncbi:MAG: helix-turn-helix domain-containing protein [Actinomycetota bacterium]
MATTATARPLELTDPRQMRALAHPLRLRLLGILRLDGPATASALAQDVGESPALVSYHLRTLGRHGFVHEDPELARDGRERWWRASHPGMTWEPVRFLDTPERAAAANALLSEIAERYAEASREWLADTPNWSEDWVEAADMSDWRLHLTPAQALRMREEVAEIIERYVALPAEEDAEQVRTIVQVLPHRRTTRR